jgi:hypothetical protein
LESGKDKGCFWFQRLKRIVKSRQNRSHLNQNANRQRDAKGGCVGGDTGSELQARLGSLTEYNDGTGENCGHSGKEETPSASEHALGEETPSASEHVLGDASSTERSSVGDTVNTGGLHTHVIRKGHGEGVGAQARAVIAGLEHVADAANELVALGTLEEGSGRRSGARGSGALEEGSGVGSDLAVDRAVLGVADAVHLGGAFVTAVLDMSVDVEGASLDASAAGLGAGAPVAPAVVAVDGARVGVAVVAGVKGGATNATIDSLVHDGASLGSDTAAALLSASGSARPAGDLAVDGAGEAVARSSVGEGGAVDTAVGSRSDNRALLDLGADGAAGLGATGEDAPLGDLAVDGARLGVAGPGVAVGSASGATVGDGGDDGLGAEHSAGAAGLGAATAESRPAGELAVDGACECNCVGCTCGVR